MDVDSLDLLAYQEGGTSGVIYPSSDGVARHAPFHQKCANLETRLHSRKISIQLTRGFSQGMCKASWPASMQTLTQGAHVSKSVLSLKLCAALPQVVRT